MQSQAIETTELEIMKIYLKVRKERIKSDIKYPKHTKILLDIYNSTENSDTWKFNLRRKNERK